MAFALFLAALALALPASAFFSRLRARFGIFTGSEARSVPDADGCAIPMRRGQAVRVEESAGGWLFVSAEDGSGWIREDEIEKIERPAPFGRESRR